jgi:hypothetical protein
MQKPLPKGHESCLSRSFKYTPAVKTDLKSTFDRVRQQLRAPLAEPTNVRSLPIRQAGQ